MSKDAPRPLGEALPPDAMASRGERIAAASRRHLDDAIMALRTMDPAAPGASSDAALAALAEAVRQQDAFLHAVAHDLRNPLAAIHGQVQLLRRRARRAGLPAADPARLDEGLAAIDAAVARMADLIDRVLDGSWTGDDEGRRA